MRRALQSVWDEQTLRPNRIVLIEDGPLGEDLRAVIAEWKQRLGESMLVLRNGQNKGLTKSLNLGIRHISTDLIARMDSDDISRPKRFELQVGFLEAHPEISIVGGDIMEFMSEKDDGQGVVRRHPYTPESIRRSIHKANPLAHSSVMMRREIFDSGMWYNERYRNNQDLELWFSVLSSGREIANIDAILVDFRICDGVFERRGSQSARMELDIYLRGIYKLHGLRHPFYFLYPLARYLFRLMPAGLAKRAYGGAFRNAVLN